MADTMTLEELRETCAKCRYMQSVEALDAAIRERDGLRHALAVEQDIGKIADTYHSEYDHAIARAKKAEAELAALRKRIADAPVEYPRRIFGASHTTPIIECATPESWVGKRVRLLVEDDDV